MDVSAAAANPARRHGAAALVDDAVEKYRSDGDRVELARALDQASQGLSAESLWAALEPYRTIPEIAGPLFEQMVARAPEDARALVGLANAYWLTGRGPEVVADLAGRAIAADPGHRGAWHLWALSESDPRARCARWRQVAARFPEDDLALASLADNLAALAGAEHDPQALAEAIETFEQLAARTKHPEQRRSVQQAIATLKEWRL